MHNFWKFKNVAAAGQEPESAELRIEGDIVDDNDAWIYEALKIKATSPNEFKDELSKHDGKPLTVWIDSDGGDVFAADGIYTALKERKGAVTVKVIKAHSAASEIAMAGKPIFISPVGKILIHDPAADAGCVPAKNHRHVADFLDSVKESIINAYQLKTGLSRAKISQMMTEETLMDARAAIKNGFADEELYIDNKEPAISMDFSFAKIRAVNSFKETIDRLEKIESLENPSPKEPDPPPETNNIGILKAKLALQIL